MLKKTSVLITWVLDVTTLHITLLKVCGSVSKIIEMSQILLVQKPKSDIKLFQFFNIQGCRLFHSSVNIEISKKNFFL